MKLWLLEILACPIDHAFPLELTILKWENEDKSQDKIEKLIERYNAGQVLPPKTETPLHSEINRENIFFVRDFLILKPVPFDDYLKELIAKLGELEIIQDSSQWVGEKALHLCKTKIKERLEKSLEKIEGINKNGHSIETVEQNKQILNDIVPELEFLNLFKYNFEIEDAIIKCPECKRWFPVFETIPQMLPDEVRNSESDKKFQEKWHSKYNF